jgi:hypothetical protein
VKEVVVGVDLVVLLHSEFDLLLCLLVDNPQHLLHILLVHLQQHPPSHLLGLEYLNVVL